MIQFDCCRSLYVGAGSCSYRKRFYIGTGKSKNTVPERPRRESSTTALKAAVKTGGLSYPHKGKGAAPAEVLKTKERRGATEEMAPIPVISVEKHGRLQRAVV